MFRKMRRDKQALSLEENINVLNNGTSGVLAVSGDDNYPYAVPLSYVYHDSKIYFHCAKTGHKLDGIKRNNKASFCVIDKDDIAPQKYTTYFRSVIVFGKVNILEDEEGKRYALEKLSEKYSYEYKEGYLNEIDKSIHHVCVMELSIEYMSGKESIELIK